MSQEIQLSNNLPASSTDYWTTQGQTMTGGPAPAAKVSPFKKAHRLLRGRYSLALVLAAAGALTGLVVGYKALQPKYESDGLVNVNPIQLGPGVTDSILPMYGPFMASQSALLQSPGVGEEALNNKDFVDAWTAAYGSTPLPSATDFLANVDAEHLKASTVIKVSFVDRNKDVAKAGTRATVAAYMKLYGSGNDQDRERKLRLLNVRHNELTDKLNFKHNVLAALSQKYGTSDLSIMNQAIQEELAQVESNLTQAKIAYEDAAATQGNMPKTDKNNKEFVVQQIAAIDPQMRNLLADRENQAINLKISAQTYGPKHPQYLAQQSRLDFDNSKIDDYTHDYLQRNFGRVPFATDDQNNTGNMGFLKQKVDSLQKLVDTQRNKAIEVGTQRQQIEAVTGDIEQSQRALATVDQQIDGLKTEAQLAQIIKVIEPGSDALLAGDKRKIAAAGGFLFGGLLPIGLIMLYGLIDHRFRYSDDATTANLGGVTLLGILPNLPDRLSDPQQAGIAAHCVHQIRTMLQINRPSDEPQVVAVTSAAPADGKTSLTLALGLSYAACGARTLLIDCDLVSAGLTHRLNISSPDGVLEAVANRALLEFVRTTDIADVAMLPVGTTHAHHASTLSPVALRRLLSESKKHFDIILVDTGPILGSIEASLVLAAADRTILTVARGQQRPLVERSIAHLQSIGARVAGVVFNRAQARDFEKSLSGLALRSRPLNGTATNGQASVAKAVGGSFKRAG